MCAVVCHWQWNGANIILLTGLRPAALEALKARDKQPLFIFLSCKYTHTQKSPRLHHEQTISCTNTLTQHESTVIALEGCLIAALSSAELWRKPIKDVYTGKEWAVQIIITPSFIKCSANAHAQCGAHHLIFRVSFFLSCIVLISPLRDRSEKGCIQSYVCYFKSKTWSQTRKLKPVSGDNLL